MKSLHEGSNIVKISRDREAFLFVAMLLSSKTAEERVFLSEYSIMFTASGAGRARKYSTGLTIRSVSGVSPRSNKAAVKSG